jgi:hypothetical protein
VEVANQRTGGKSFLINFICEQLFLQSQSKPKSTMLQCDNIYNSSTRSCANKSSIINILEKPRKLSTRGGTGKAPQRTKSEESTNSKKRSRHTTQQRTVSFAPTKEMCPTFSVIDYTPEEVKACWYKEHEYDLIIQECLKVIKKMQGGKPINAHKYCVRGLDRFAPEAADLREVNKLNAYIAVLEEQNNQLRDGHCDPQEIARHYRAAASRRCQLEAQKVGERDALFVQKLLNSCVR